MGGFYLNVRVLAKTDLRENTQRWAGQIIPDHGGWL